MLSIIHYYLLTLFMYMLIKLYLVILFILSNLITILYRFLLDLRSSIPFDMVIKFNQYKHRKDSHC